MNHLFEQGRRFVNAVIEHTKSLPPPLNGVYGVNVWVVDPTPQGCEIRVAYVSYEPGSFLHVTDNKFRNAVIHFPVTTEPEYQKFGCFYLFWEDAVVAARVHMAQPAEHPQVVFTQ